MKKRQQIKLRRKKKKTKKKKINKIKALDANQIL